MTDTAEKKDALSFLHHLWLERVKEEMVKQDMKPTALASRSGLTTRVVSACLAGKSKPDLLVQEKIAQGLGVPPWHLLVTTPSNIPGLKEEVQAARFGADPERRAACEKLLKYVEGYLGELDKDAIEAFEGFLNQHVKFYGALQKKVKKSLTPKKGRGKVAAVQPAPEAPAAAAAVQSAPAPAPAVPAARPTPAAPSTPAASSTAPTVIQGAVAAATEAMQRRQLRLPIRGAISSGKPVDNTHTDEFLVLPEKNLPRSAELCALKVVGNGFQDEGLYDGDLVVIQRVFEAKDGKTIVALSGNQVLVKNYFREKFRVRLQSANPSVSPQYGMVGQVQVLGEVIQVVKKGAAA